MIRRINSVGVGTLTVSLPAKWAKKVKLKKGDEVSVVESHNSLVIFPSVVDEEKKEKEVAVSDDPQFNKLVLNNLYRYGYDLLKVRFKTKNQYEHLQDLSNNYFLGFEITQRKKEYCVIENVTEPQGEKYDILLRRIFLIIKESLNIIHEDFKKNSFDSLEIMRNEFNKVNQFSNFCMRTLNKEKAEGMAFSYLIVYLLLVLQSELRHMYEHISSKKISKVSGNAKKTLGSMVRLFEEYYVIFYGKKPELMAILNLKAKKALNDVHESLNYSPNNEKIMLVHMSHFLRIMTLLISPSTIIIS